MKETSGPARRIAWASTMTFGVAHFTPTTPGTLHSASIAGRPMPSLRRYSTTGSPAASAIFAT